MVIGITGGIGSGKSTIAQALAKQGLVVYDCDREAKRIIAEDAHVQAAIISLLGNEAFVNGRYNTAYVAKRVFAEPELLERMNNIVHPAVRRDIKQRQPNFVESAILFESGLDTLCDKIVVVDAPEEVRIARTIQRDYHGDDTPENIEKVRARIRVQGTYVSQTRREVLHLNNDGNTSIPDLVAIITHWM